MAFSPDVQAEWNRRQTEALALLNNPIQFARDLWEFIFGNDRIHFETLFCADTPRDLWANRDEAMALIRLAYETPGAEDQIDHAFGLAGDILNNFGGGQEQEGIVQGVVLEGLRQALLKAYLDFQRPHDHRRHDAKSLAELRAKLAAIAAGS